MPTPFDGIQDALIGTVNGLFSVSASRIPPEGGEQTGKVLFKKPSKEYQLAGFEYTPTTWIMEYYEGVFPGLKESSDANETNEIVIEEKHYYVRKVERHFDGKTLIAVMEEK